MKTKIHIISIQEGYLTIISKQLELIFGDKAVISKLVVKDLDGDSISAEDIVVLSRKILMGVIRPFIPKECKTIIAHREVNIANTKRLISLPAGQKLLVVNDTLENAQETLDSLENIFFTHTYYLDDENNPDQAMAADIDYIVTPGEMKFVPSRFSNVIDIGNRLLSYGTVWEIAEALEAGFTHEQLVNRYVKSQVSLAEQDASNFEYEKDSNANAANLSQNEIFSINRKIEEHGFLKESIKILSIYAEGKARLKTFGRIKLKKLLEEHEIFLSEQQIRLRLEILQELGLLNARQGRSGTTITNLGESYYLLAKDLIQL
ncbi:winged-helix domain-containing protein [Sporosarcina sp. FSL W8-0480]|uniref:winged-helix domain-containing protein n=1 Tax=Sporosarcina sp. FSL W8-0480 TaxID=2954701 RepID=UPI0030D978CA